VASRKRFRRRSSGRKARKLNWSGGIFQAEQLELTSAGLLGYNDGDVAAAWCKWPSRTIIPSNDPTQIPNLITPVDDTLVRTIVGSNVTFLPDGALQDDNSVTLYFGIIPWDSEQPNDLAGVIAPWPAVPHPANPANDWVIRIPFCFTKDNFQLAASAPNFIESRAMRKLPASTGLLMCVGVFDALEDGAHHTWDFCFDVRQLFKSGAYEVG